MVLKRLKGDDIMPKIKEPATVDTGPHSKRRTQEGREDQLIALAYDLVEERLRNGTATSQETTLFLKLGSRKDRLERDILKKKIKVLEEQAEALQATKRLEALYSDAINAARSYMSPSTSGTMYDEE